MNEKISKDTADVGIIVGRFQINKLHEAHLDLVKTVKSRHPRVIVILGNAPIRGSINDPLDFRDRRAMFNDVFPDVEVHYINDVRDDDDWSKNLDKLIGELLAPFQKVVLYGSRDSFLKSYSGKFTTVELEATSFVSATENRRQVANFHPSTADFRAGKIAMTYNRYPTCYQTVDVAILRENEDGETEILLARKPNEKLYRFVGGFSDPKSKSLEDDARREAMEETGGCEISDPVYVGSMLVNDWRYKNNVDKIKTALFVCDYVYGRPEGSDDVAEVKWFKISNNPQISMMVEEHKPLYEILVQKCLQKRIRRNRKNQ